MRAAFQNLFAPDFNRKLAEAQHVPLIEEAIANVLSNPKLKGDALHPNAEGNVRLTEEIFKEMQSHWIHRLIDLGGRSPKDSKDFPWLPFTPTQTSAPEE